MRTPAERRLDDRQLTEVRAELHDLVDRVLDALPVIQRQEREWGRGYPASTTGGGGGGSPSSITERAALDSSHDPAGACAEWRVAFDETVGHLRGLAGRARKLLPLTEADIRQATARQNTVEVCPECSLPVGGGKRKRLDGALFHDESPGTDEHGEPLPVCFWQAYRRRERSA